MLEIDDIRKKLTVRVNDGTGVLVSPLDKDILYVFTCRHVVLDEGKNILPLDKITISYDELNSEQEHVFTIQSIEVSEQENNDIAVLVVKRDIDVPHLYISSDRIKCYHIGFPKSRKDAENKIGNILVLHIAHFDSNSDIDIVEYQYDVEIKENEIKGMSGGGIFNKDGKLVGIHTQSAMHDKQEMLGKGGMIPIGLYFQLIKENKMSLVFEFDLQNFREMVTWIFDYGNQVAIKRKISQFYSDIAFYKEIVQKWSPEKIMDVLRVNGKIDPYVRIESLDKKYWNAFTLFVVSIISFLDLNEADGERAIMMIYENFHFCYNDKEIDVYEVREKIDSKLLVGKKRGAYLVVGGLNNPNCLIGCYAPPESIVPNIMKARIIEQGDISQSREIFLDETMIINNHIFERVLEKCADDEQIQKVTIEHFRQDLKRIIKL